MKYILSFVHVMLFAGFSISQITPTIIPPNNNRKVQLAILFDTSNSMDGLIDQAKSRIWSIVNEASTLQYQGQPTQLEIALYEYGNDGLEVSDNYIRRILELTTDLDEISKALFGLRTNGGSEYCGAVIDASLDNLGWSNHPNDLRMIYIAGNESFEQGPILYKTVCSKAKEKNVFVNTIFCGSYEQGIALKWQDGASCSSGDYFNIDSNKEVVHIDTPYDADIKSYSDSLNTTYYGYGSLGRDKKAMQATQDMNASSQSTNVAAERAISKSNKAAYKNASWDLIDASEDGVDITKIADEELPAEFKGKTAAQKTALLEEKKAERSAYQERISKLAQEREKFIADEMQKRAESGEVIDDFGTSVNQSILEKAEKAGLEKQK